MAAGKGVVAFLSRAPIRARQTLTVIYDTVKASLLRGPPNEIPDYPPLDCPRANYVTGAEAATRKKRGDERVVRAYIPGAQRRPAPSPTSLADSSSQSEYARLNFVPMETAPRRHLFASYKRSRTLFLVSFLRNFNLYFDQT